MRGDERERATDLRLSLAAVIAVALAGFGLHPVFQGGGWWFELVAVSVVVLGAAAWTRAYSSRRWVPSAVAAVVVVGYVVVRFAGDTAILLVLPTGGTIGRIVGLAEAASASIRNQSIPATVDRSILLLVVVGIGIVAVATDFVAIGVRRPALAGIPLAVPLVVPAMTDFDLSDGLTFALAAIGYLWLVLVGSWRRRLGVSMAVGAFAIVAALVVPFVLPPVQSAGGDSGGFLSTGINPTINLGKDLKSSVNTTAAIYTMNTGGSEYLRLVTLDKFAGQDWAPEAPKQLQSHGTGAFASPPGLSSRVAATVVSTEVTVGNLRSPWLPLPYPTSSVSGLSGDWYWEPDTLTVSSPDVGIENQNYQVTSLALHPTPAQLSAAGSVVPSGFEKYLALPAGLPAIISDTAQKVAGGEQDTYSKAVALQQYLRGDPFTYSVKAPIKAGYDGTSMAVVAKFLEVKSGYCVHFASAMAVMARSLGIPARIAVGFQPGRALDTGNRDRTSYRVTTHDLHTWPELYFDRIGWVPFEPTPGRGEVPSYADLSVPGVPAPLSPAQLAGQSAASPAPSSGLDARGNKLSDLGVGASRSAGELLAWLWIGMGFALLLFLALLPALWRIRIRSARRPGGAPGDAWSELLDLADDLRLRLPATLTPREVAVALAPVAAGEPLDRVRIAVERESFASGVPPLVDPVDVRAIASRLRAAVPLWRRFAAAVAPPSVWRRVLAVIRNGGRLELVRRRARAPRP